MSKLEDLTGRVFGRWTVLSRSTINSQSTQWTCVCECGTTKVVPATNLKRGISKSCGCLRRESLVTHGLSHSYLYSTWVGMIARCTGPRHLHYKLYGGRGISVQDNWLTSFEEFYREVLSTIGSRPSGFTLDRIDNNKGYVLGNIRWASHIDQARNRRGVRLIAIDGESLSVKEACERFSAPYHCVLRRLNAGWDTVQALTTPSRRPKRGSNE